MRFTIEVEYSKKDSKDDWVCIDLVALTEFATRCAEATVFVISIGSIISVL